MRIQISKDLGAFRCFADSCGNGFEHILHLRILITLSFWRIQTENKRWRNPLQLFINGFVAIRIGDNQVRLQGSNRLQIRLGAGTHIRYACIKRRFSSHIQLIVFVIRIAHRLYTKRNYVFRECPFQYDNLLRRLVQLQLAFGVFQYNRTGCSLAWRIGGRSICSRCVIGSASVSCRIIRAVRSTTRCYQYDYH
ncbi:hypothetical protein D3C75_762240 [compost metagenome]